MVIYISITLKQIEEKFTDVKYNPFIFKLIRKIGLISEFIRKMQAIAKLSKAGDLSLFEL